METHPNVDRGAGRAGRGRRATGEGSAPQVIVLDDAVHTAAAAAEALGVEVGQIANSLIFDADGEPLLVLTSGAHRVDTAKVAAGLGVGEAEAGHPGVRPRAHRPGDRRGRAARSPQAGTHAGGHRAASSTPMIWAAGGVPRAVFPITYAELLRVTAGTPADVA